jgi:hypothetical protein
MTQATKTTRTTRASGTRKKTWTPPSKLDTPTPPDGVHYRWVRHELLNEINQEMYMKELVKDTNQ